MVATFIAIVVPQLVALRYIAAAATAGTLAFFWQAWPYKLGLLGAVFAGVAVGVLLSMPRSNTRNPSNPSNTRGTHGTRQARGTRETAEASR
jgi:predicted branched-subunit amino acid permease